VITDKTLLFSDDQAITGDAASENVIDLGATGTVHGAAAALTRDIGKGNKIPLLAQVTEDFTLLTSLTVQVQCDSVENFASPKTVAQQTIALADLVAGKTISIDVVPPGVDERYMRLNYDVTGTNPGAGKITAGIVAGVQTNGVNF
jgi:hypothetical protein